MYQTFYRWLPKPAAGRTYASWINDRGDVAGFVEENGSERIVFWRAGGTGYQILGDGFPVGLDETGRVVSATGEIHHPDGTRGTLQVPLGGRLAKRRARSDDQRSEAQLPGHAHLAGIGRDGDLGRHDHRHPGGAARAFVLALLVSS